VRIIRSRHLAHLAPCRCHPQTRRLVDCGFGARCGMPY